MLTNVVVPTAPWGIVPITATPQIDQFNGWNTTTKQYKPSTAGFYHFFTQQYFGSGMTNGGHVMVRNDTGSLPNLNAADVISVNAIAVGGGVGDYLAASGIAYLNGTTDFVRLWAYSDQGQYYPISTNVPTIRAYLLP